MKNFNILGVHWKIQHLGDGSSQKTDREGDYLKRGALTFCRFKGGLVKKEGVVFLRGRRYPDAHYEMDYSKQLMDKKD